MFMIGQPRIFSFYFVLLLTLFLIPQTICAEEITLQLPGGVPITLIKVPAGTFLMGSPEGERGNNLGNETQHQVTLTRDYYLGKTEVTHRQWEAVMGAPVPWPSDCALADGGIPESSSGTSIYCVSWNSINGSGGFIEKLNDALETDVFRLPSEAEWERAARAGTTTRFSHGDALECSDGCLWCAAHGQYMWWCGNAVLTCLELDWRDLSKCGRYGHRWPNTVGRKQANPFGFHDMHGNLREFVNDRYGNFSSDPVTDPAGPAGNGDVVIRGGGREAYLNRSASRSNAAPGDQGRTTETGFRIAASHVDELAFKITNGLSDAWYNPATDGQGFLLTVFPNRKEMFLAWFTYDTERPPEDVTAILGEPGHRWLTAQGPYEGDTANLTIFVTEGGVFDSAQPVASTNPGGDGTMTIEFVDCSEGLVSYEIISLGISGEIPIQRIVPDNISLCETLSAQ
jgi:formylglycine-generating enzyme required for sulfatase activity